MDDHEENYSYDTQPGETDAAAMGNLYPRPTQSYHNQPPGPQAAPVGQNPMGPNTLGNQTTIQAQPIIHPIYQPPPVPQPAAPQVAPPPALQPVPPQGVTLPTTGQATGQTTIVAPRTRGMGASAISVILGILSVALGLIPACGIVALLPGLLGVVYGWRGMKTRRRNLALFGVLLSVVGIVFAFAVVV